jgi:hypothetical protein
MRYDKEDGVYVLRHYRREIFRTERVAILYDEDFKYVHAHGMLHVMQALSARSQDDRYVFDLLFEPQVICRDDWDLKELNTLISNRGLVAI